MNPMLFLLLLPLLTGCIPYFPWDSSGDRLEGFKTANPLGCTMLSANAKPPASDVTFKAAGGWGMAMTPEEMNTCLDKLKELP